VAVTLARNSLGQIGFCVENFPLSFVFGMHVFADVTPNRNEGCGFKRNTKKAKDRAVFVLRTLKTEPIRVAAQSKAWVCFRSLAGTVGSNPARGMDVCLL
jgi:hypothetical protein